MACGKPVKLKPRDVSRKNRPYIRRAVVKQNAQVLLMRKRARGLNRILKLPVTRPAHEKQDIVFLLQSRLEYGSKVINESVCVSPGKLHAGAVSRLHRVSVQMNQPVPVRLKPPVRRRLPDRPGIIPLPVQAGKPPAGQIRTHA